MVRADARCHPHAAQTEGRGNFIEAIIAPADGWHEALSYRVKDGVLQVLLAHPGGPYFQKKDDGAWSIPRGEPKDNEELLLAALLLDGHVRDERAGRFHTRFRQEGLIEELEALIGPSRG
jgi:hypothetical protein